jgi:hypothetical protein
MENQHIIVTERVDDIPVLLTQIEQVGIRELIDKHFPTHGNRDLHICARMVSGFLA